METEDRSTSVMVWVLNIFFPVVAPGIMLLLSQRKPRTFNNSVHALFFDICLIVLYVILFVLGILTFGLSHLLIPFISVLNVVVSVVGAIAAGNGRVYEPPVSGGMVKSLMRRS